MAFLLVWLLAGVLPVYAQEAPTPEPARPADSLVESIGLATHWGFHNTIYSSKWDELHKLLGELGVRTVRDGFDPHLDDLWKMYGIRAILIAHPDKSWDSYVEQWKQHRHLIAAIEGPNEVNGRWDRLHFGYEGTTWPEGPKRFQDELYAHVKGEAELSDIPVICLSLWNKGAGWQIAPLRSFDYANAHSYAGGQMPSASPNFRDPYLLLGKGATLPPLAATESGYHTCLGNTKVIAGAQSGVSHRTHQKYIPRQVAEYFNAGMAWTVIYEFAAGRPKKAEQEDPEAAFGLLMPDGTPKPAYFALKDLIAELSESRWDSANQKWIRPEASAPRALSFALQKAPPTVHHTLLQRSDGSFQLLLWNEVPSFDLKKKKDIANRAIKVTLLLENEAQSITVSRLGPDAAKPQTFAATKSVELSVPDEVLVVAIKLAQPLQPHPLTTPTGIEATAAATSAELSWPWVEGVDAYWVSCNHRNLGAAQKAADGRAHFAAQRLIPATTYPYEIVAAGQDGGVSAAAKIAVTTVDAFPDLVVRSLKILPESPREGDAISFVAVVENIGKAATEEGVLVGTKFQVDGKTICWCDTLRGPLPPGKPVEVHPNNGPIGKTTWTMTPGTHRVTAIVDDADRLVESSEANNRLTIEVEGSK